jgi:hypothetical protein
MAESVFRYIATIDKTLFFCSLQFRIIFIDYKIWYLQFYVIVDDLHLSLLRWYY